MVKKYEFIRPSEWIEGADLTKRDIWRGLRQYTTVHGIPNLTRARGSVKKVFWVLAFCSTMIAFLYNVSAIIMSFADFPVTVSITLLHETELIFPAVTICNMSPVRRSSLEASDTFQNAAEARRRKRRNANADFDHTSEPPLHRTTASYGAEAGDVANAAPSCCCSCCFQYYGTSETCSSCAERADATTCSVNKYQDIADFPIPTSSYSIEDEPDPQPVEGSKFPERVETRESYQEEEKLTETLANINFTEKSKLGFKAEDLILDCQYAGSDCYLKEFATFYNPVHGNCYIFNSGWNSSIALKRSHKAGRRHGLHMIVNIDQDDYVKEVGDTAGLRVVVHPQDRMPFPEDEGITVATGYATSIGLRQVIVNRKPHPYGNCRDPGKVNYAANVYEELYPVRYSSSSCIKTCFQKQLIKRCGCADPQIPFTGVAFGNTEGIQACDSSNIEQDDCEYEVRTLYNQNKLDCDCPSACRDMSFALDLSSGVWPSNVQETDLLQRLSPKIGYMLNDITQPDRYKQNLVKLEIYYEEFNFEEVTETQAYPPQSFLSDVGGVLGLWLGMSILTLFEYVEFFIDMAVFSWTIGFGRNRVKSLKNVKPDSYLSSPKSDRKGDGAHPGSNDEGRDTGPRSISRGSFTSGDKRSSSSLTGLPDSSLDVTSPLDPGRPTSRLTPDPFLGSSAMHSRPTTGFGLSKRRASLPYYANMKSSTLGKESFPTPLSARQVALYEELEDSSPPPPYTSRRSSEVSDFPQKTSPQISPEGDSGIVEQDVPGTGEGTPPPCNE